jgi:acetylornithine deacetylase/succinyl-diaminopimelate desuccinylase-like protein
MELESYFSANRSKHLEELKDFLRISSISALSEHKDDMKKAADWVAEALTKAGLKKIQIMPTPGHPVVYGEWLENPGKPTVLIYGHYDVQPVDPVSLWKTPPFEPDIRDEKIYARGATDDKGQVFMYIKAIEAFISSGKLPVNVKFCIEGEEEIGSPHLDAFVDEHRELLSADILAISDTTLLERGKPAICYGLRGLCGLQIDITGPKSDLHSGLYGGAVHNPIHALTELLASMHDREGKVTIKGFYDRVQALTDSERQAFRELGQSEERLKKELGVTEIYGEKGYSAVERTGARPTLEINGIWGGFSGEGTKTIIPAEAHAKITCRLVPNQDPEEILQLIERHVTAHTLPGVRVQVRRFDQGRPFLTPIDHPAMQAAARAYKKAYGVEPVFTRMGGSIPIVETFGRLLNLPVVMMGFGLPDENFHAPNEHFNLENFDKGLLTMCYFFNEIAG